MIRFLHRLLCLCLLILPLAAMPQTVDTTATQSITDQFLTELLDFTKDAGAFAKEEIPLVLKEYVVWGIASSIVWLLPFMVMLFFSVRVVKWSIRVADDTDGFSVVVAIVYAMAMIPGIIFNLLDMLKAIIAPRVYLIETLSDLIK
jgi:hypothetical protein